MELNINGQTKTLEVAPDMPLLWALRDELGMTGTKYGCGMSLCGACTVHMNGQPIRACVTPVSAAAGMQLTTIESNGVKEIEALQEAWTKLSVPQCGYCQPGQIMTAAGLLKQNKKPSDAEIDAAMSGNICRCGTYNEIRAAIKSAAAKLA
jgi:isoquinoline 1-oxidoreductase alpha subunit